MTKPAPIAEAEIHGYADGQLDDSRQLAVKDWLAAHPEDAARVADYRLLGQGWREAYAAVLREPVPGELLGALRPRRAAARRQFAWAAAGVVATLVALAAWTLVEPHHLPGSAAAEMVERAAIARAHPYCVGSAHGPHRICSNAARALRSAC